MQLSKIRIALERAMSSDTMMRMAKGSGFCERLRSVQPQEVALAVIAAMATRTTETIADIQRLFNALTGRTMAYKPFHNKLAKPAFAEYMRMLVSHLLNVLIVEALRPMPGSALALFDDILIQDGSSFAVHPALAGVFPGRHTTISPAAVELHATMSLWNDQAVVLTIAPDSEGERQFLPQPQELHRRLLLGDRGYQSVDYCREVAAAGGFVLIRHQTRIDPLIVHCWINDRPVPEIRGRRLQTVLREYRGATVDADVQWQGIGEHGRPDTRLRVVLVWNAQRKDHMAFVTNLPRNEFSPADIYALYRLRWQVELLFKEWKSYCNLHRFGTGKEPIAKGLIWGALAACIIKRFMAKAAQRVFNVGEVSTRKTAMTGGQHLYAIFEAAISGRALRDGLLALLHHLSTQALRAHPERDRRRGRLRMGLLPVSG